MHNNILLEVFSKDQLEDIATIFSIVATDGADAYWWTANEIVGIRTMYESLVVIDMTNDRSAEMSINLFKMIKSQLVVRQSALSKQRVVELPAIPREVA